MEEVQYRIDNCPAGLTCTVEYCPGSPSPTGIHTGTGLGQYDYCNLYVAKDHPQTWSTVRGALPYIPCFAYAETTGDHT